MIGAHGREKKPLLEGPIGNVEGLFVTEGTLPLFGRIELSPPGAEDNGQDGLALFHQGHADAAVLVAAGIVGRSVNGVDNPDGLVPGDVMEIFLLAEESHLRVTQTKLLDKEMLYGQVRRGDDILPYTLVVDLEPARAVHQGGGGTDNIYHLL